MSHPRFCGVCLQEMPAGYVDRHEDLGDCVHALACAVDALTAKFDGGGGTYPTVASQDPAPSSIQDRE